MTLIDRLHLLFDKIGIKPAVGDAFVAAVGLAAFNLITTGSLDVDGLRLAAGALIIGAIGVAAPAATGVDQRAVRKAAPALRKRATATRLRRAGLDERGGVVLDLLALAPIIIGAATIGAAVAIWYPIGIVAGALLLVGGFVLA